MSDSQEADLAASMGNLTIEGNNNTINVVVSTGGTSQAQAEAAPKAESKAKAKAKGKAKGRAGGDKKRFFVICRCSKDESLQGIWHCSWNVMCGHLPGHQLFGSSARPCQGFDTLEDAVSCWQDVLPEESYILHEP